MPDKYRGLGNIQLQRELMDDLEKAMRRLGRTKRADVVREALRRWIESNSGAEGPQ